MARITHREIMMKRSRLLCWLPLVAAVLGPALVHSQDSGRDAKQAARAIVGDFVRIPPGEFQMGSGKGDDDERPVHRVRLAGFEMSRYEVAQAQWEAAMGSNPSRFRSPFLPVEQVSWEEAQEFIQR